MTLPKVNVVDDLPRTADLVVVGGGVIGAATAFFAARAGLDVLLLEKRPALCTLTTPVSTGAFRLQFDNPEEIALVREGIALFDSFAEAADLPGWGLDIRHQGYLFCATTPAGVRHQLRFVDALHGWGVSDVELISGDEARYRFPYVGPDVVQARYRPDDGWLDPTRLTFGYARASHARVCLDAPVIGLCQSDGRLTGVKTPRGDISCHSVVVAAGPFSGALTALAGVTLDLRPTIRHKVVIPDFPALPEHGPMTIHEETAAHWRPGLRGGYALLTDPATPSGEPMDNVSPDANVAFALFDPRSPTALARISPLWATAWQTGTFSWILQAGQYTYTPDHRPLLGPWPGLDGLLVNCGYSGHGIMASAGGSRLVMDTLLGRLTPEANPFRPDRPMVERPLDIL